MRTDIYIFTYDTQWGQLSSVPRSDTKCGRIQGNFDVRSHNGDNFNLFSQGRNEPKRAILVSYLDTNKPGASQVMESGNLGSHFTKLGLLCCWPRRSYKIWKNIWRSLILMSICNE